MARSRRILWMGVAVLAAALAGGDQIAATASPYKCYVGDSLYDGLVPGKVQAAGSVDCSGYGGRGSVRFTVRLQQYDSQAKKWKNVKSRSRRYRTLRARHGLAVLTPCVVAKFRASYTAVLKNAAGARVSANVQKLGPLQAHVPCMLSIGGAPTAGRVLSRHGPSYSSVGTQPKKAARLSIIIPALRARGYRFIGLDQLLASSQDRHHRRAHHL